MTMKHSKLFITISLLAAVAMPAFSCIWFDTHNYYLFSVCQNEEFSSRMNEMTRNNWKTYLGSTEEYYWFDAEEIIKAAEKKNDALMVSYVKNLKKYLKCANDVKEDRWEYPTKEELNQRSQTLSTVRTYALSRVKSRLRSQHALLYMRCNMLMGRHQENVLFWEQTASQFIWTVYRDMMENIYAGALLKTGRKEEASQLFAKQGDWSSLMTIYYEKRSFQAIRQEYLRNPNSAVLPFLLQDFVNNAQEAIDGEGMQGKLFVRDIERSEAQEMWNYAGQVVREGKTNQPALWMAAKAWLEYMFGDKRQALTDAQKATTLEGTPREKDKARVLQLYITAAQTGRDNKFDDYLASELKWLEEKKDSDVYYDNARNRLVYQVLVDKYTREGRQDRALSLLNVAQCGEYDYYIDTMSIKSLSQFIDYVQKPTKVALDSYLAQHIAMGEINLDDLMGTKYLRLCQWEKAQQWLQKVPLSFYQNAGYSLFAAIRSFQVEPWVTRQWLGEGSDYTAEQKRLKANPKLVFAREMQKMESELNVLAGQARQQRCYDLAVRYAQACYSGDCWYLTHDTKSVCDTVRVNEADLTVKAVGLLREASKATDFKLKERALFALAYVYMHSEHERWFIEEWNGNLLEYITRPRRQATQYKAFAILADFEKEHPGRISDYVSRCDEYIQFRKQYQ